jgi:hypothetical protein
MQAKEITESSHHKCFGLLECWNGCLENNTTGCVNLKVSFGISIKIKSTGTGDFELYLT